MTPGGRTAYVLEPPYGVAVVNLAAAKLARFIKIPEASAFALTPDGATLYVANRYGSTVTPVDTATGNLQRPIVTQGTLVAGVPGDQPRRQDCLRHRPGDRGRLGRAGVDPDTDQHQHGIRQ